MSVTTRPGLEVNRLYSYSTYACLTTIEQEGPGLKTCLPLLKRRSSSRQVQLPFKGEASIQEIIMVRTYNIIYTVYV